MSHAKRVAALRAQMKRALSDCDMIAYTTLLEQLGTLLMNEARS